MYTDSVLSGNPSRRFSDREIDILDDLIITYGQRFGQRKLADMIYFIDDVKFNIDQQDAILTTDLNHRSWSSIYGRLRRQWKSAIALTVPFPPPEYAVTN